MDVSVLPKWAISFNKGTPPPMDDRAIFLPWDKKFVLTSLGQAVVYGGNY